MKSCNPLISWVVSRALPRLGVLLPARNRRTLGARIALVYGLGFTALVGCRAQGVALSSEPSGASVLINEQDSGFVTPCVLDLSVGNVTRVDFALPGYTTATRMLVHHERSELAYWRESSVHYNTWNFPLWLNAKEFYWPVTSLDGKQPGRVFVRLAREADAGRR